MATKVRVLGARSSLRNHEFPLFYACYLLKSLALPLSRRATYIGSTPDPPRRLKQHNGQIPAGARRTVSQRPWEMQMVVHGFPSKMAALQFEWAWQHPHKSRHFREQTGRIFGNRGTKRIDSVIKIVRTMITRPPFNNWPLHVKLFTGEAVKLWNAISAQKHTPATPPGFTCSIELEGVDGNSGHPGSGRKGAIAVKDLDFTNAHLAKHKSLLATQKPLECSICLKPVHNYATEPLETCLCPSLHCTAVSHLSCLSQHFLASEATDERNQSKSQLIPRGANCKTCNNYILWGDVIRGSYRRFRAMQKTQDGADDAVDEDDLFVSDEDGTPIKAKKKKSSGKQPRRRSTSRSSRRKSVDEKTKTVSSSSSGESFDFDNISSDSESEPSTVRRTGRTPKSKVVSLLMSPGSSKRAPKVKATNVRRAPRKGVSTLLDSSNSEAGGNPKRKPGRPKGSRNTPSPDMPASPPGSSLKNTRKGKAKATVPQETFTMDDLRAALAIISNNRLNLGSHLVSETKKQSSRRKKSPTSQRSSSIVEAPAKRKPGRPRKTSSSDVSAGGTSRRVKGTDASPVISSIRTKPETITRSRGRPRSEASLSSSNSDSSLDTPTRKRGRPRKTDPASSSSNDITIISHKRKPGRPPKERDPVSPSTVRKRVAPKRGSASDKRARDSASSSSNDITIISHKRKPGRPRKEKDPILPSTVSNGVCKKDMSNSGLVKRKPGRPRKEKDPESPPPLGNRVLIKQKADRTSGLMPSTTSLTKSQFSTVSSSKMGMHTQSVQNDSSSGESFDFTGLSDSDASDEDFERYLARNAKMLNG